KRVRLLIGASTLPTSPDIKVVRLALDVSIIWYANRISLGVAPGCSKVISWPEILLIERRGVIGKADWTEHEAIMLRLAKRQHRRAARTLTVRLRFTAKS